MLYEGGGSPSYIAVHEICIMDVYRGGKGDTPSHPVFGNVRRRVSFAVVLSSDIADDPVYVGCYEVEASDPFYKLTTDEDMTVEVSVLCV